MNRKRDIVGPILIIIIGLILIILPPVFRKVFASRGKTILYDKSKLVCIKHASDNYVIKSTTKYTDDDYTDEIVFEFTNNNKTKNNTTTKDTESEILLKYYASLFGTRYSVENNVSTIELSEDTKEYYSTTTVIKTIFSNYDIARAYYESEEYECK